MNKVRNPQVKLLLENNFIKQILRFVITGALSAGLEFLTLIILVEHYQINILSANVVAFIVANVLNYALSRSWVFEKGRHSTSKEFIAFVIVATIGLGLNQLIMWIMVDYMAVYYQIAKIFAIGVVVIWNFVAKKKLVFQG